MVMAVVFMEAGIIGVVKLPTAVVEEKCPISGSGEDEVAVAKFAPMALCAAEEKYWIDAAGITATELLLLVWA